MVSESAFSPCSSHSQTRESAAKRSEILASCHYVITTNSIVVILSRGLYFHLGRSVPIIVYVVSFASLLSIASTTCCVIYVLIGRTALIIVYVVSFASLFSIVSTIVCGLSFLLGRTALIIVYVVSFASLFSIVSTIFCGFLLF